MKKVVNIRELDAAVERLGESARNVFDGGSGGGYDGRMETRIAKLEEFATDAKERLVKIESRLEHTATQADVERSSNKIILWIGGILFSLSGAGIAVMTFVLNNATPKAAPAAPTAPAIYYVQPPAPVAAQAATPAPPTPAAGAPAKTH